MDWDNLSWENCLLGEVPDCSGNGNYCHESQIGDGYCEDGGDCDGDPGGIGASSISYP